MIQSAATKYAIRAVCHLAALPEGSRGQAKEIAEELEIPYHYLSKILQDLARKGLLDSSKGPGGGFRLAASPESTSLYTLIEAVEGPISEADCVLGLVICSDEAKCPMHDFWQSLRDAFRRRMESVTLEDVVIAAERKRQVVDAHAAGT